MPRGADHGVTGQDGGCPAEILLTRGYGAHGFEEVAVRGSGTPRREFLHVDDLADACLFPMESGATGAMSSRMNRLARPGSEPLPCA